MLVVLGTCCLLIMSCALFCEKVIAAYYQKFVVLLVSFGFTEVFGSPLIAALFLWGLVAECCVRVEGWRLVRWSFVGSSGWPFVHFDRPVSFLVLLSKLFLVGFFNKWKRIPLLHLESCVYVEPLLMEAFWGLNNTENEALLLFVMVNKGFSLAHLKPRLIP